MIVFPLYKTFCLKTRFCLNIISTILFSIELKFMNHQPNSGSFGKRQKMVYQNQLIQTFFIQNFIKYIFNHFMVALKVETVKL